MNWGAMVFVGLITGLSILVEKQLRISFSDGEFELIFGESTTDLWLPAGNVIGAFVVCIVMITSVNYFKQRVSKSPEAPAPDSNRPADT